MAYAIRPATRDDAVRLARLIRRAFAPVARRFGFTRANWAGHAAFTGARQVRRLMDAGFRYLVCESSGRWVGCVAYARRAPDPRRPGAVRGAAGRAVRVRTVHVRHLAVEPAWQGGGIGRMLMEAVEQRGRRWGARRVTLGIAAPDRRLGAWYVRRGFAVIETSAYNDLPCKVTWMSKRLVPRRARRRRPLKGRCA